MKLPLASRIAIAVTLLSGFTTPTFAQSGFPFAPQFWQNVTHGTSTRHGQVPPLGDVTHCAVVGNTAQPAYYPNQTCATTAEKFMSTWTRNYHLKSRCPVNAPMKGVFNVHCENGGYTASVCCGTADHSQTLVPTFRNLNLSTGASVPCPKVRRNYSHAALVKNAFLQLQLGNLENSCRKNGHANGVESVTVLSCGPDPRPGYGLNARADVTCAP